MITARIFYTAIVLALMRSLLDEKKIPSEWLTALAIPLPGLAMIIALVSSHRVKIPAGTPHSEAEKIHQEINKEVRKSEVWAFGVFMVLFIAFFAIGRVLG